MATKQQLEESAEVILENAEKAKTSQEQFCIIWNGTIKPILGIIRSFPGQRLDDQIDKLIYAADKVCDGSNPDVANYCKIWKTAHLKEVLRFVENFTNAKVDKVIDKFIEISDGFCPEE